MREVVAGPDGKPTNKLIGVALKDHQDAYAADCKCNRFFEVRKTQRE